MPMTINLDSGTKARNTTILCRSTNRPTKQLNYCFRCSLYGLCGNAINMGLTGYRVTSKLEELVKIGMRRSVESDAIAEIH